MACGYQVLPAVVEGWEKAEKWDKKACKGRSVDPQEVGRGQQGRLLHLLHFRAGGETDALDLKARSSLPVSLSCLAAPYLVFISLYFGFGLLMFVFITLIFTIKLSI